MAIKQSRKGELAILSEALLFSLFPVVTILSYARVSPIAALAWSSLFAAVFFGAVVLLKRKWREFKDPGIYKYIFYIAFFIGWLYYGLYFIGLKFTSAGNAAIIDLMEIFFSYLLFNIWQKEYFSRNYKIGALLMLIGAVVILLPKGGLQFHGGDWLVLAAAASAPAGNYFQQKLRQTVSSESILFLRSLFSFPIFFLLAFLLKTDVGLGVLQKSFWFLALNGLVLLGLAKLFWLEGIHRISVTKANALSSAGPLFTLGFAYLLLHQIPTWEQLLAFVPMAWGMILLTGDSAA